MNILNILEKYESPESEASFYKGIPIKYLKDVQKSLLFYDSLDGVKTFRYILEVSLSLVLKDHKHGALKHMQILLQFTKKELTMAS